MNLQAIAQVILTDWISKLIMLTAGIFAGVGIRFDDNAAALLAAAMLTGVHLIIGHFNLRKALNTPTSTPPIAKAAALFVLLGMSLNLMGCAGMSWTFPTQAQITATAEKIGDDTITYTQTLANMVQTVSNLAGVTAPAIEALANQWGLLPADSTQLATFNKVVNTITNVNSTASGVEQLLTSLQSTGIIPAATSSTGNYHYTGFVAWEAPLPARIKLVQ